MAPFLILALPRSRTYWFSRFLSYGGWECGHEQARFIRSVEDVKSWLSQDCSGSAETSVVRWWRLAAHYRPDLRTLIVRRPRAAVVDSLMRLPGLTFDRARLEREVAQLDRRLDQAERSMPNVLSVAFDDLTEEASCKAAFEHCLPFRHDRAWWRALAGMNLQANMPALMRYMAAHSRQIARTNAIMRQQFRAILSPLEPLDADDGVTIAEEPFRTFYQDGRHLFAAHCGAVGEAEDQYLLKNTELFQRLDDIGALQVMTARCNGRMFGYLLTIIGPSAESRDTITATQTTFFGSPDLPNIGARLQRASLAALPARGVGEVIFRAGVRGEGARMGVLYRRMGAEPFGQLYRLKLAVPLAEAA